MRYISRVRKERDGEREDGGKVGSGCERRVGVLEIDCFMGYMNGGRSIDQLID